MKSRNYCFLLILLAAIMLAGALPAFATITARIDYPEEQGRLYGNVKIAGAAKATGEFNSYVLEVQRQPDGPWQTIAQQNIQVPDFDNPAMPTDVLGLWETGGFQSGEYQIRLTALAEGTSQSITREHVFLGNCTSVTGISVAPVKFNPYAGKTTAISYSLPEAGEVTIKFYDALKNVMDTQTLGQQAAGPHTFSWNGKGPGPYAVNDNTYTFSIKVYHSGDQSTQIYYPSDGLVDVTPTNVSISSTFRPQRNEKCEIHYTIDRPCWVRIEMGSPELMYALLHAWGSTTGGYTPQLAGSHTDYWDGRKGVLPGSAPPLILEPEIRGVVWANTLPDNFIITEGRNPLITELKANPVIIDTAKGMGTDLSYTLSRDMDVTIKIYDGTYPGMRLVRTLINQQRRTTGVHTEHWDGLSDGGFPGAPPSPYTFAIEGTDTNNFAAEPRYGAIVIKGH